jgi:DNA-binding MarR family transcriptional regulator
MTRLSPAAAAYVALQKSADLLGRDMAVVLKEYELSPTQYNVLRILRGAGAAGLPCGEIAARMITRDPDITRLLDRMEKQGWLTRERGREDRRVVTAVLTKSGRALVDRLDQPVEQRHRETLGQLGKARLVALTGELQAVLASFGEEAHPSTRYDDNRSKE